MLSEILNRNVELVIMKKHKKSIEGFVRDVI